MEVKQSGARSWANRGEEKGAAGQLTGEGKNEANWLTKMANEFEIRQNDIGKAGMSDCDWKASRNRRVQMEFKTIN